MKAVLYERTGGPEVLQLADRVRPTAGEGEVLVRVMRAGVNPTDWKSRTGERPGQVLDSPQVPGMDAAGLIEEIGDKVDHVRVGQRVWVWLAADRRKEGATQELLAIPAAFVAPLPDNASFDLGASLGIPFITAHRCLTVAEGGPLELAPGALAGRTVLVAGGAGAVGNAAIQLAKWSGATVVTTVSSDHKADLARAAGADHVLNYREEDVARAVRQLVPEGVDIVVEVAPATNAAIDSRVLADGGTVAVYARDGGPDVQIPVWHAMAINARWQFVLIYHFPEDAKRSAVSSLTSAMSDGALRVGPEAGLPLHHYPLAAAAEAHAAVEGNAIGKVIIDVE